jgi:transcriptional regulator with XRE-family HTH domain
VERTQDELRGTFRTNLRVALGSSPYTQEGLARELGLTLRAVQKWFGGHSEPKGRQLVRLGEALGRDPSWFFADHEPEPDDDLPVAA